MNSKDRKKQKDAEDNRKITRALVLFTQFGINMLVPIFLCFFVGMILDKKLGTGFCMIIGFFVGALAGFRNVYICAVSATSNNGDEDSERKDNP